MHLMTVVGTRPEIIRLSSLIKLLDSRCEHTLVHTGQNYAKELKDVFFQDLQLRQPDHYLDVDHSSVGAVIGNTIIEVEKLLIQLKPDALLALGDTNSALAAISAKKMGIPVYHMEAGNRSYDENVPEEVNRRLVDHIADFNLPYSEHAMRNLLREGLHPRRICVTGSPLNEVIDSHMERIRASDIHTTLGTEPGEYLLVSAHRQENVDSESRLRTLMETLRTLSTRLGKRVLVSLHPRTERRINELGVEKPAGVSFHAPFGFLDYMKLQMDAYSVLSDSGSISEESSILGFAAVTLRDSMERPEALDSGAMIMAGVEASDVMEAVAEVVRTSRETRDELTPADYKNSDFSLRVYRFILSTLPRHSAWAGIRK